MVKKGLHGKLREKLLAKLIENYAAEEFPKLLVSALYAGYPAGRKVAEGNMLAIRGDRECAAIRLAHVLDEEPSNIAAVTSLGALISKGNLENLEEIWEIIRGMWTKQSGELHAASFRLYALGIDVLLRLGEGLAERHIRETYLPFMYRYERLATHDREPVLYWHVPKTGGTSISTVISRSTYASGMTFLPSYTSSAFLKWLVINNDGVLPFLSSSHLSAQELGLMSKLDYVELAITRDPLERALSAWRQYFQDPAMRLSVLPQHGHIWSFFPRADLESWSSRAPRRVINPWEWTFSGDRHRFKCVDHILPLEELDLIGPQLIQELGFGPIQRSLRVAKNVTIKSIRPELGHLPHLVLACAPDVIFLNRQNQGR